ncbi:MAG TPA: phage Gp37/Gp68 family protein [Azospirillum sp.]|nr:phage Gp37/Gp68 family protein [Azospirillum sp.]
MSKIEWTESTWNPIVGCTIISPGCTNCYAMRMAFRCEHMGQTHYIGTTKRVKDNIVWTGVLRRAPDHIVTKPLKVRRPTVWFVNSMSDLFHEDADPAWVVEVIEIMARTPHHTYQVLTKRPEVAAAFFGRHGAIWPDNAWLGISVEDAARKARIEVLRHFPARIRFLSVEPLLGPVGELDLAGINWVITGGESGPGARLCRPEWVREVRDQCVAAGVAYFHKQWGQPDNNPLVADKPPGMPLAKWIKEVDPHGKGGALLDGRLWREFPE